MMSLFSKLGSITWLVVFLGNPGSKYENTRHNAGFLTASAMEEKYGCKINKSQFQALTATCVIGSEKVMLMKPQTYMNLSGEAVRPAADYYKIPADHIIVISDEMSLSLGRLRIRAKGSAGGHNGLKNIIACLGTDAFPRIRLGVGAPPPEYDVKDWVLSHFQGEDLKTMQKAADHAADAIECYIKNGCEKAMNQFNCL